MFHIFCREEVAGQKRIIILTFGLNSTVVIVQRSQMLALSTVNFLNILGFIHLIGPSSVIIHHCDMHESTLEIGLNSMCEDLFILSASKAGERHHINTDN